MVEDVVGVQPDQQDNGQANLNGPTKCVLPAYHINNYNGGITTASHRMDCRNEKPKQWDTENNC